MREHPILFSGPMVRAILEGRKTQTRRVMKPQPTYEGKRTYGDSWAWRRGKDWFSGATTDQLIGELGLLYGDRCPYGRPCDLLWVRENWAVRLDMDSVKIRDIPHETVGYWADGPEKCCNTGCAGAAGKVRPSIHMPRWASRLTLRITDVRVQRVQEITEEDAKAEGIEFRSGYYLGGIHAVKGTLQCWPTAREAFAHLWDSINAKRGYSWESNPWVWAITFSREA